MPGRPDMDRITVVREGGRIATDGRSVLGGDDTVGIAAALETLALCGECPSTHRGVDVILMVQEELGCRGSRMFNPSAIQATTGFNLDGKTASFTATHRTPHNRVFRLIAA